MKKTNANINDGFLEAPIKQSTSAKPCGGGHFGRPILVNRLTDSRVMSRTNATFDEKARAKNFQALLRELSPDFDLAYRKVANQDLESVCGISDAQIDELAGPILKDHGYDIDELAVQRENSSSVKAVQMVRPTVFDLDLTEPCKELRKFQIILEWIARAERWSQAAAYLMPVLHDSDGSAAVFASLETWERTVSDNERGRLVAPMRRAHKRLMMVAGTESRFNECRIVHFLSDHHADACAARQLLQSGRKEDLGEGNGPLVLVEGKTVIAALPRDEGNRVTSATVAVEEASRPDETSYPDKCLTLPDMNAIMAHAEGARLLQAENLS